MKRLLVLGLISLGLLNGCSKCTRESVPPPPAAAPELNPPPDASPELPADGEPATPAFPDGSQDGAKDSGEVPDTTDESVD